MEMLIPVWILGASFIVVALFGSLGMKDRRRVDLPLVKPSSRM